MGIRKNGKGRDTDIVERKMKMGDNERTDIDKILTVYSRDEMKKTPTGINELVKETEEELLTIAGDINARTGNKGDIGEGKEMQR